MPGTMHWLRQNKALQHTTSRLCAWSQPKFCAALLHWYSCRALTSAHWAQKHNYSLHFSIPSYELGLHISPSTMATPTQLSLQSWPTTPSKPDPCRWPITKFFKDFILHCNTYFRFISNLQRPWEEKPVKPQADKTGIYMVHDNSHPTSFWHLLC